MKVLLIGGERQSRRWAAQEFQHKEVGTLESPKRSSSRRFPVCPRVVLVEGARAIFRLDGSDDRISDGYRMEKAGRRGHSPPIHPTRCEHRTT